MRALSTLAVIAVAAVAGCASTGATVRPSGREGDVTFAWRGEADAVFLAGTMTAWRRVPLARDGATFRATLRVPPGRHEYRLEVEAGGAVRTVLPEGAERIEDGFGGENAVLRQGGT